MVSKSKNISFEEPQNPYASFMVNASAGSGKTYQLTRRFIYLVIAGAHPSHILTITFTVKAAMEMKARIISEAAELLRNDQLCAEYKEHCLAWFWEAQKRYPDFSFSEPIEIKEAAEKILITSQSHIINTIDSLFHDWLNKFPLESSMYDEYFGLSVQPNFSIGQDKLSKEFDQLSWQKFFAHKQLQQVLLESWQKLKKVGEPLNPLGFKNLINHLLHHQSFLSMLHNEENHEASSDSGKHRSGLVDYFIESRDFAGLMLQDVLKNLSEPLISIAMATSKSDILLPLVHKGDFVGLVKNKLLTQKGKISGSTIRGKKREMLAREIQSVDEELVSFFDYRKLQVLAEIGNILFELYRVWVKNRNDLKGEQNILEFSDLVICAYSLIYKDFGPGVLWSLMQKYHHIMIDEFQDTSLMQWRVFEPIISEMISGTNMWADSGVMSTTFLVGDKKQSIYGFREADPEVVGHGRILLESFGHKTVQLNKNYRSAAVVLDFVNKVFTHKMENFPEHKAAIKQDLSCSSQLFIPDCGGILLAPLFDKDDLSEAVQKEAEFVAERISYMLAKNYDFPIYDSSLKGFRALRASDVCILYRDTTHAQVYEEALQRREIQYKKEEKKGFFTSQEIDDIIALLKFIVFPDDLLAFAQILRSPLFAVESQKFFDSISFGLTDKENAKKNEKDQDNDNNKVELLWQTFKAHDQRKAQFVQKWQKWCSLYTPQKLFMEIYSSLNVYKCFNQALSGGKAQLSQNNLSKLMQYVLQCQRAGIFDLSTLLYQIIQDQSLDQVAIAESKQEAVSLMTIHKSKGLEFPAVFVVGCHKKWNKLDSHWLKVKDSVWGQKGLAYIGKKDQHPEEHGRFNQMMENAENEGYKESLRLLYVALTRARQYLVLSGIVHRSGNEKSFYYALQSALLQFPAQKVRWSQYDVLEVFGTENASLNKKNILPPIPETKKNADVKINKQDSKLPDLEGISIIQPHSGTEDQDEDKATDALLRQNETHDQGQERLMKSLDPEVAAKLGVFIHQGICDQLEGLSIDPVYNWNSLLRSHIDLAPINPAPINTALAKKNQNLKWRLYNDSINEMTATLNHNLWKQWQKDAKTVATEIGVAYLEGRRLVNGYIDILFEFADYFLIIDLKTTTKVLNIAAEKSSEIRRNLLFNLCHELKYAQQLRCYKEALQKLHPEKKIFATVWFTKTLEYVEV